MSKKAIILFSGGLDSTTCLAQARADGFECYALSFSYGQKHNVEIEYAKKLAQQFAVTEHRIISNPIGDFGGSSLTDPDMAIPDYSGTNEIPDTYVPARNTIFLAMALSWGEVIGAHDIYFGANCIDYSHYPDCRPEYLEAFEKLATLATKVGVEGGPKFKVHAPLLHLNKAGIIRLGLNLGVDYGKTISCYRANSAGQSCGTCDCCTHRKRGFAEAGVADPTVYI